MKQPAGKKTLVKRFLDGLLIDNQVVIVQGGVNMWCLRIIQVTSDKMTTGQKPSRINAIRWPPESTHLTSAPGRIVSKGQEHRSRSLTPEGWGCYITHEIRQQNCRFYMVLFTLCYVPLLSIANLQRSISTGGQSQLGFESVKVDWSIHLRPTKSLATKCLIINV